MRPYYECHITIEEGDPLKVGTGLYHNGDIRHAVEEIGWNYSAIDGDLVVGPGRKHYATKHMPETYSEATAILMTEEARHSLRDRNCNVIRSKVESVVWDAHKGRDFND